MERIVIGNLLSMAGCTLMVLIGFVRHKERILWLQCVQFGILATANLVLGAVTGAISGVVGVVRNLVFTRVASSRGWKLLFLVIQAVLALGAKPQGLVDWLPILSGSLFTWYIDLKSETGFKAVIIAAQAMWLVYDLAYRNYVSASFDVLTILSNLAGIVLLRRKKPERAE